MRKTNLEVIYTAACSSFYVSVAHEVTSQTWLANSTFHRPVLQKIARLAHRIVLPLMSSLSQLPQPLETFCFPLLFRICHQASNKNGMHQLQLQWSSHSQEQDPSHRSHLHTPVLMKGPRIRLRTKELFLRFSPLRMNHVTSFILLAFHRRCLQTNIAGDHLAARNQKRRQSGLMQLARVELDSEDIRGKEIQVINCRLRMPPFQTTGSDTTAPGSLSKYQTISFAPSA